MVPIHIFLLFCLFGANFPPLGVEEASRLSAVVDGRDSLDDGFSVLVKNVERWEQSNEGQVGPSETPALSDVMNDPTRYRGDAMQVSGELQQRSTLEPPLEFIEEWFVRGNDGVPFVIYVVGLSQNVSNGQIAVYARFYKTIKLTGRDGTTRLFATFVTSGEAIVQSRDDGIFPMSLLLVPIVVVGALSVFLLCRIKTKRSPRLRKLSVDVEDVILAADDLATDLPDDPAEALALLHESAEELT